MIVYLSGPITGNSNYKATFARVAEKMRAAGFDVINPAELDRVIQADEFPYEDYVSATLRLLAAADIVAMLPGWQDSPGARREAERARELKKQIMEV